MLSRWKLGFACGAATFGASLTALAQTVPDCATVPFEECKDTAGSVGECDCLKHHAAPYRFTDDDTVDTIEAMLPGTFKAPVGIANAYCGYIVPEPDYNTYVSVLTDDGDHYEETNSCSVNFAPLVLEAFASMRE